MTAPAQTYQMMLVNLPGALKRPRAAAHCDVSVGYFDRMVREGILPQPRLLGGGVKVWLRQELDDALFALGSPDDEGGDNTCDAAFGL